MKVLAPLVMLLVSFVAHAGSIRYSGDALITEQGERAIENQAGSWPFDVSILVSSDARSKSAFETEVGASVYGQRVLALGIDPKHRFVVVRFGSGLKIDSANWPVISSAGNSSFKSQQWAQGVIDIGNKTNSYMGSTSSTSAQPIYINTTAAKGREEFIAPPVISDSTALWWLVGFLAIAILICIGAFLVHRRREQKRDADLLRQQNLAEADRILKEESERQRISARIQADESTPSFSRVAGTVQARITPRVSVSSAQIQSIAPQPVIIQPSVVVQTRSDSDGFVNGLLVGEMLHLHHEEPQHEHVVERVVECEVSRPSHSSGGWSSSFSSSSSDNDSGGSSSSWSSSDSGGSSSSFSDSSSSCDSGGSSSDW